MRIAALVVLLCLASILSAIPVGDTLTVIMKPLPNLPTIVVPGENMFIECKASPNVSNWQARLLHGNLSVDLPLTFSVYDAAVQRWRLGAVTPTPDIYEIYDLEITASGSTHDLSRHCVDIIPERRNSYYFVHITDAHMPTTYYYDDPESVADSSSMEDMREVIRDINLIHPEFVLFTGDLVHEGELEDYQGRRYYTRAQKILNELDVPVFVTVGNHDVGGWDTTPPSDGTARRNWWRFFGWRSLQTPPIGDPRYTQDYSFDYGPVHFIGLEAYDNYDEWMYNVYGANSFIVSQIDWLEDDISNVSPASKIVLFYHYDFDNQISLSSLGADLALYGHGHQNAGSLAQAPWNLETDNICDNNRAYRPVRIEAGELSPKTTQYAGDDGENLNISFYPNNNGSADSVSAVVQNQGTLSYDNARIKFLMPNIGHGFSVHNGTLVQVDRSGTYAVCYVTFNLAAGTTRNVSVAIDESSGDDATATPGFEITCYPNPFQGQVAIRSSMAPIRPMTVDIFNPRGQKVRTLSLMPDVNAVLWDGQDEQGRRVGEGVYLVRAADGRHSVVRRVLLLR